MEDIFYLQGEVVTARGNAIRNLRVAVVDKDLAFDDLLGVGITDERGAFRISFTSSEFRQQPFEREQTPDIYLVFSAYDDGVYKSVARKNFYQLTFPGGVEDLGEIRLEEWGDGPPELPEQNPTPGYRVVNRLNLSDELVAHCLEEVTPLVEHLTGWTGLLDDVEVRIATDVGEIMAEVMARAGMSEPTFLDRAFWRNISLAFAALYEPISKTVLVNSSAARKQNLDSLKVILGHELVHVGQFKYSPGLEDEYISHLRTIKEIVSRTDLSEMMELVRDPKVQLHMYRIEGYAAYIQEDFLENYYNCATHFYSESYLSSLFTRVVMKYFPEIREMVEKKLNQYSEGKEIYVARADGGRPARFDSGETETDETERDS